MKGEEHAGSACKPGVRVVITTLVITLACARVRFFQWLYTCDLLCRKCGRVLVVETTGEDGSHGDAGCLVMQRCGCLALLLLLPVSQPATCGVAFSRNQGTPCGRFGVGQGA